MSTLFLEDTDLLLNFAFELNCIEFCIFIFEGKFIRLATTFQLLKRIKNKCKNPKSTTSITNNSCVKAAVIDRCKPLDMVHVTREV